MTHITEVEQRPEHPTKESRALVVKKLDPKSNTVLTRVSSNKSSQIIIKGDVVVLKRRQSRVSETIDRLKPGGSGAQRAWKEWLDIDDELKELEEGA